MFMLLALIQRLTVKEHVFEITPGGETEIIQIQSGCDEILSQKRETPAGTS